MKSDLEHENSNDREKPLPSSKDPPATKLIEPQDSVEEKGATFEDVTNSSPQTEMIQFTQSQPIDVKLLGSSLLPRPTDLPSIEVPTNLKNHPLIEGKCFYALPSKLLKMIANQFGAIKRSDLWPTENLLSKICGDFCTQVGFVDSKPLYFPILRSESSLDLSDAKVENSSLSKIPRAKLDEASRTFQLRSKWYNTIARGYAGWLNCNPEFRREREQALGEKCRAVSLTPNVFGDAAGESLPENLQAFLVRWRLLGMAGPRLPIPMRPMLGGQFPLTIIRQLLAAGGLFNIPDTYPIPGRDELRAILEEAVRATKPEHLREWCEITGKGNPAKNKIVHYSRIFELHHYWEVLQERYGEQLHRQSGNLLNVFADFFSCSPDATKADLRLIRRRLKSTEPL